MVNVNKPLRELIDKIAIEQGFRNYNVDIKPISSDGANYSSLLYLITISGDKDDLKLFAKVANMGIKLRESVPMKAYDIERAFYTRLLKLYREIEDRHKLPAEHRINTPKYYGCNPNFLEETIVLEDLVHGGYKIYDRLKPMDWAYASKAVEEIAKFHALSHALKKEDPEKFQEAARILKADMEMTLEIQKVLIENNTKLAVSVAKDEHKEKITQFMNKLTPNDFKKYFVPLGNAVMVHGDYRISNLLYKIDEDGSLYVKTIDFQTMQATSPVLDLFYLIFTGTDEEFRRQHYQALIEHYYEQLCAALHRMDIVPDAVYTRKQYDQELREKLPYGLVIAIYLMPIITVEAENAPVVDEDADLSNFCIDNVGEMYPERMRGIINDFVRMGVL